MADDLDISIKLSADGRAFINGVEQARTEFNRFAAQMERGSRGIEQSTTRAAQSVEAMGASLKTAGRAAVGALVVSEVLSYARALADVADAASMVNSKLALVAGSAQNTTLVYGELFKVAQSSRVGFSELADTYAQIARSAADSGISQERLIGVSKALSQAITVSGGSAQSASAAMVQLSQGLASGTLRGEELNSILEQTPRVAQGIAQGLGVSIGALRKLGTEGKLTTDAVIGALEKAAPAIAAEFDKITPTIGSALTTVSNSGLNLIGVLDKATGASAGTAKAILSISASIDSLSARLADPEVMRRIERMTTALRTMAFGGGVFGLAYDAATGKPPERSDPNGVASSDAITARRGADASATSMRIAKSMSFAEDKGNLSKEQKRIAELQDVGMRFGQAVQNLGSERTAAQLAQLTAAYEQGVQNIEAKYKDKTTSVSQASRKADTERQQAFATGLADQVAAVKATESLKLGALESMGRQGLRTEEMLASERLAIQTESIDKQIAIAERARSSTKDVSDRARATATINDLERSKVAVIQDAANRVAEIRSAEASEAVKYDRQVFEARERDNQALRDANRDLADEAEARRISLNTKRDERAVLLDIRAIRLQTKLDQSDQPDPQLEANIRLLREQAQLIQNNSIYEKSAAELSKRSDQITQSLTDAIYRGFENGKSFADAFASTLKATIGTLILRPIIEPVVKPLGEAISGSVTGFMSSFIKGAFRPAAPVYGDIGGTPFTGVYAQGGTVDPYTTSLVGENGPEVLKMGSRGASVIPLQGGGGRGEVNIVQNFQISAGINPEVAKSIWMAAKESAKSEIADAAMRGDRRYG
jgi:tape measure domain-containing protein